MTRRRYHGGSRPTRAGASRRSGLHPRNRSAANPYGVPVPAGLHEAIENERDNLSKADSVLGCLVASLEDETDSANKPYYPDVAQLARDLLKQSINGLDSLVLQQHLLRNKIKESPILGFVDGAYPSFVLQQKQAVAV
jgi:hypothetical protein